VAARVAAPCQIFEGSPTFCFWRATFGKFHFLKGSWSKSPRYAPPPRAALSLVLSFLSEEMSVEKSVADVSAL